MAYDQTLATRVRRALARHKAVSEIKMFGGLCFTIRGNMCCGVLNNDLVIRVARGDYEKTLAGAHVRPMNFTGRPLRGFVFVGPGGYKTGKALAKWVKEAVNFAMSLPPKA